MEAPGLWPWLDADFLDQRRPGLPVRLKCLSLPSTAVEAKHPLRVQTLAQRVVGQQPVDLDDDLLVAAAARSASMASSQAVSRSSSSRWITAVANGASATSASGVAVKQRQRLARGIADRPGLGSPGRDEEQPFETVDVDEFGVDSQLISPSAGDDLRATGFREHTMQAPHVVLDHFRGAGRRRLPPQTVVEPLDCDRAGWLRARASRRAPAVWTRRARPYGGRR